MIFKEAKCPNCGGELRLPEDKTVVKCMYCGGDVMVRESIEKAAAGVNIGNLFDLAKSAFDAGNFQEAFDYYTKILEVDSGHYEAWLGKGLSAGWMSTLADFRMSETLSGIDKAIINAPEDRKEEIREQASLEFMNLINVYYKHLDQYVRNNIEETKGFCVHPQTRIDILNVVNEKYYEISGKILMILSNAVSIFPMYAEIPKKAIDICMDNIRGYGIRSKSDYDVKCTDKYEIHLKELLDSFTEITKKIEPSYQKPVITKSSDQCFVATSTMGHIDHPVVIKLREFRDTWLLKRRCGQVFVRYYYKFGPCLATFISRSNFLRHLSYRLIIRPSVYFAHRLLKK